MREAIKVIIRIGAAILLVSAGFFACAAWSLRPQPLDLALPMIVRDLPGDFREGGRAFEQRVRSHFPVGIDERIMTKELASSGFKVGRNYAELTQERFPCQIVWQIRWEADVHRIRTLNGQYGARCP